jgi:prophage tail gpP-like protein
MPDVRLSVNGNDYGGWKSMRISRGIEQLAGTFELTVSELWPGQKIVKNITPGDSCTVTVEGGTVITGYVDDLDIDYSAESHEVTVKGRDATGDLVDCSAIHRSGKWASARLEAIVADLCAPFGIKVRSEIDSGVAVEWNIQEGETAHECLDRLAKSKGVLLISDGKGGLVITRAGKGGRVATGLERGVNILRGKLQFTFRDRFGQYTVKGQGASSDALFGEATRLKAVTKDPMIARYRPLIIIADDLADGATLKRRALWEANVRSGKAAQIAITLQGWSHPGGLWAPNTVVHVRDPWLRVDADLLIKGVTLALDDTGGTVTELAVTLPQAFDLIPMPKKKADPWEMLGKQQQEIDKLKRDAEKKR